MDNRRVQATGLLNIAACEKHVLQTVPGVPACFDHVSHVPSSKEQ